MSQSRDLAVPEENEGPGYHAVGDNSPMDGMMEPGTVPQNSTLQYNNLPLIIYLLSLRLCMTT